MPKLGKPYCSNCGYELSGADTSAECPECGLPLVEVLERMTGDAHYTSKQKLWGLPLIDVAYRPEPGQKKAKAVGIIAIGDHATGVIAIGGFARGFIAVGGICFGGFTSGGLNLGLVSVGGLVASPFFGLGGVVVSAYYGMGGVVAAHKAYGGLMFPLW